MNNSIKTYGLISFTLYIGKYQYDTNSDFTFEAKELLDAAKRAGAKYPGQLLRQKGRIEKVNKAVNKLDILGLLDLERKKLPEIFAFVLTGIDEILSNTKNTTTKEIFSDLLEKIKQFNTRVDPHLNNDACYVRGEYLYDIWCMHR